MGFYKKYPEFIIEIYKYFHVSDNDNNTLKFKYNNLKYNAWYYSVELDQGKLYFYYYDIYTNNFYIRTNYHARNFKIMFTKISDPSICNSLNPLNRL